MKRARTYGRFVKIEHTLFSFPLLLSGALLARGELGRAEADYLAG